MLIIPAIDILNRECTRLTQGDFRRVKNYKCDPIKIARQFNKDGARLIHVVDLDGARAGKPMNLDVILKLRKQTAALIQVGGGIRTYRESSKYLSSGVYRVILGTAMLKNTSLIKKLIIKFGPARVAVSIDVKNNKLAINGWQNTSDININNLLNKIKKIGVTNLVITDTKRDGLLKGPNFKLIKWAQNKDFNIIAAGGVTTKKDLTKLAELKISGAIIGKAIYENKINLQQVIKEFNPPTTLTKRVIPCMDIKNGQVVKGIGFKKLRNAGDPVKLAKYYSGQGADELVFLDITATNENRNTVCELARQVAKQINIPFTIGGGIKNIADIKNLLNAGADKVSIGSAAVTNFSLVTRAAKKFGSQCIVISVDAKKCRGGWNIYINGGCVNTKIDAIKFCQNMERLGAGELLVNSLDQDGTKKGYDLKLLRVITQTVNIPVIASSGAGRLKDFLEVLQKTDVDAVLAASVFHTKKITIPTLKNYLVKNNMNIRL